MELQAFRNLNCPNTIPGGMFEQVPEVAGGLHKGDHSERALSAEGELEAIV